MDHTEATGDDGGRWEAHGGPYECPQKVFVKGFCISSGSPPHSDRKGYSNGLAHVPPSLVKTIGGTVFAREGEAKAKQKQSEGTERAKQAQNTSKAEAKHGKAKGIAKAKPGSDNWTTFGAILAHLGPSWPSWGHLEAIFGHFVAILGHLRAILGHLGGSCDQDLFGNPRPEITVPRLSRFGQFGVHVGT